MKVWVKVWMMVWMKVWMRVGVRFEVLGYGACATAMIRASTVALDSSCRSKSLKTRCCIS